MIPTEVVWYRSLGTTRLGVASVIVTLYNQIQPKGNKVDKKTITMKRIIQTMQEALNETVKQDTNDFEQLTDVDNAFNEGWKSGMELAIFTIQELANEYIISNIEDK